MRNALESGVERIKREKEQKKSDSRKVESKVKLVFENLKIQEKRRSLTQKENEGRISR